jgi:hypothetical protein
MMTQLVLMDTVFMPEDMGHIVIGANSASEAIDLLSA